MGTFQEIAAFCQGKLGPGKIKNYEKYIRESGLTIPILSFLHIGRPDISGQNYGDLIYNDPNDLLVSDRGSGPVFNPNGTKEIWEWPKQVAMLKQDSSVKKIFFSVGGDGAIPADVRDFRTIQHMFQTGQCEILRTNLKKLREVFTFDNSCVIDGIDINCEEFSPYIPEPAVKDTTIIDFSIMLHELGFEVTFCPFDYLHDRARWQYCMQKLQNQGYEVSWWNLQCYHGGDVNRRHDVFQLWIDSLAAVVGKDKAVSYLMPGLIARYRDNGLDYGQCPCTGDSFCETFEKFAKWSGPGLRGGWLWSYDLVNDNNQWALCNDEHVGLLDYVQAIEHGLDGTA